MGKDLHGKELGEGLAQRSKDQRYTARFTTRYGKRITKYFDRVEDAKRWLLNARYADANTNLNVARQDMTVDKWSKMWLNEVVKNTRRPLTYESYCKVYKNWIGPNIGRLPISEVKPLDCLNILSKMLELGRAKQTINQTRIVMSGLFKSAIENDLIDKNPITSSTKPNFKYEDKEKIKVLNDDELARFLTVARRYAHYDAYRFVLNTGLRVGELVGLQWKDVDLVNRVIHIRRSCEYDHGKNVLRTGPPKSKNGYRTIPLTDEAYEILQRQKQHMSQSEEYKDFVFVAKDGTPTTYGAYNELLNLMKRRYKFQRLSIHMLRHTFATHCIKGGMIPKTLQVILGHADISTTMNIYVHVNNEDIAQQLKNALA